MNGPRPACPSLAYWETSHAKPPPKMETKARVPAITPREEATARCLAKDILSRKLPLQANVRNGVVSGSSGFSSSTLQPVGLLVEHSPVASNAGFLEWETDAETNYCFVAFSFDRLTRRYFWNPPFSNVCHCESRVNLTGLSVIRPSSYDILPSTSKVASAMCVPEGLDGSKSDSMLSGKSITVAQF